MNHNKCCFGEAKVGDKITIRRESSFNKLF